MVGKCMKKKKSCSTFSPPINRSSIIKRSSFNYFILKTGNNQSPSKIVKAAASVEKEFRLEEKNTYSTLDRRNQKQNGVMSSKCDTNIVREERNSILEKTLGLCLLWKTD